MDGPLDDGAVGLEPDAELVAGREVERAQGFGRGEGLAVVLRLVPMPSAQRAGRVPDQRMEHAQAQARDGAEVVGRREARVQAGVGGPRHEPALGGDGHAERAAPRVAHHAGVEDPVELGRIGKGSAVRVHGEVRTRHGRGRGPDVDVDEARGDGAGRVGGHEVVVGRQAGQGGAEVEVELGGIGKGLLVPEPLEGGGLGRGDGRGQPHRPSGQGDGMGGFHGQDGAAGGEERDLGGGGSVLVGGDDVVGAVVGRGGVGDLEGRPGLAGKGLAAMEPLVRDGVGAHGACDEAGGLAGGNGDVRGLDLHEGRAGIDAEVEGEAGVGAEGIGGGDGVEADVLVLGVGEREGGVGGSGDRLVIAKPLERPGLGPDDGSFEGDAAPGEDPDALRWGDGHRGAREADGGFGGGDEAEPDAGRRGFGGARAASSPDVDGAVGAQGGRVEPAGRDLDEVGEGGPDGRDLAMAVVAPCEHAPVGPEGQGVVEVAGGDLDAVGEPHRERQAAQGVGAPATQAPGLVEEHGELLPRVEGADALGRPGNGERAEVVRPPCHELARRGPCDEVIGARRKGDGVGEGGRWVAEDVGRDVPVPAPDDDGAVGLAGGEEVLAREQLDDVAQSGRGRWGAGPRQHRAILAQPGDALAGRLDGDEVGGGGRGVAIGVGSPAQGRADDGGGEGQRSGKGGEQGERAG